METSVTLLVLIFMAGASPASQQQNTPHHEVEVFVSQPENAQSGRLITELGLGEGSRRQDRVPSSRSFPCSAKPSNKSSTSPTLRKSSGSQTPSSVHRLRPQDVSVVAAMGDSLVTGFGALANSLPSLFSKDQGVSWSIGGDGSWRTSLTLPNILRHFNPKLVGFATTQNGDKHFGMGEPQSHDEHLLRQARRLVAAMKEDPRVDVKKDWKHVTILTGQNDLCSGDPCFPAEDQAAREHGANLRRALDYLYVNLPRTFVSLLPVLDVTAGWRIEKSLLCGVMSIIECRCLYATGDSKNVPKLKRLVEAFHRAERDLVTSGRYDSREDFTVELQQFTAHLEPPRARNFLGFELADLSLFSVDCFHLSQKGHAAFATMQWNNLLQPSNNKSQQFLQPLQHLSCPSDRAPYLFTRKNSRSFQISGRQ